MGGNLPTTTFGQVLEPSPGGNLTGVVYNVSYAFTFADNGFKSNLESYLQSIQVVKRQSNPWFYNYTRESSGYVSTSNFYSLTSVTYDANKVENWIFNNQNELGGFPSNGWTLMFMNLPELPSYSFNDYRDFLINQRTASPNGTAHYYNVSYQDLELGYRLRYRDYMTGWGGVHRFWFNDLSAGPSFWTSLGNLPLQIALEDNHLDLKTPYGKTWFTQYFVDYISQATWNFVTPFFEYTPTYSEKYTFNIHVFDNRTDPEKQAANQALASPLGGIAAPVIYVIVGIVIGFVVAWIALRRRARANGHLSNSAMTKAQTLKRHAYCTNCGKPTHPNDLYCHYCGVRLSQ